MNASNEHARATNLLSLVDVMQRTRLGRTTIYRWMGEKRFPQAIKLSERCTRWAEGDIEEWIKGRRGSPPMLG